MKTYLIALLAICFGQLSFSQSSAQSNLDSLIAVAKIDEENPTNSFNAIKSLILHYSKSVPDSMYFWADYGVKKSQRVKDKKWERWNQAMIGEALFHLGKFEEARIEYKKGISEEKDSFSLSTQASVLSGISKSFLYSEDKDSVMYYGLQAMEILEEIKDTSKQIQTLSSFFQVQSQLGNLDRSKEILSNLNHLVSESKSEGWYGSNFLYQGIYYYNLASKKEMTDSLIYNTSLDSSLYYYKLALKQFRQENINQRIAIALANIGLIQKEQKNWDDALKTFQTAQELSKEFNNPLYIVGINNNLADCYTGLGQAQKAIPYLVKGVAHFKETNQPTQLYDAYGNLSLAYYKLKNWKKAAEYKDDQLNVKINLLDSLTVQKVNELETKYETAKKEQKISMQEIEIERAAQRQSILSISLFSLAFLSLISILFIRHQQKIKSKLQESEINTLKKENKIIQMQSLLSGQEEERKRIAQDLHDNIGSLMATIKMKVLQIQKNIEDVQKINIATEVDKMINHAATEVRRISHNMTPVALELTGLTGAIEDLENQLQQEGIETKFEIDLLDQIEDKEKSVILFRVIQELINNVIKHSGANFFNLKVDRFDNKFLIEAFDNGSGLSSEIWENSEGLGMKLI